MDHYLLAHQNAYADLLSRLQDATVQDIPGAPTRRVINKRAYWYMRQRLAGKIKETYLGPETDDLLDRIRAREDTAPTKEAMAGRRDLVKSLRAAGFPTPDRRTGSILAALAKAGAFRLGAVLIGTHAFRCYPAALGVKIESEILATEDIDITRFAQIPIAITEEMDPSIGEVLKAVADLLPQPTFGQGGKSARYRSRDERSLVELMTPMTGPDTDELMALPVMGAFARPLRFLDFLIDKPEPAAVLYDSGVLVNVPNPIRYALHKLIVSQRRGVMNVKRGKDIAQAETLLDVLIQDRPGDVARLWEDLVSRGPKWREHAEHGFALLPHELQEWVQAIK
jgi:hypothetical protein